MASSFSWLRYMLTKVRASLSSSFESYRMGQITGKEFPDKFWKDVFQERLTTFRTVKGEEMVPTFSSQGEKLLIRKLPFPSSRSVFVGDVVVIKDPLDPKKELIRRVAAVEGEEMVSTDENDKPFHLPEGHCWVLCDNESLKNAPDSRKFGPMSMRNILGRAIYRSRSTIDHGHVTNSDEAMRRDSPILAVELDVDELSGNTKT